LCRKLVVSQKKYLQIKRKCSEKNMKKIKLFGLAVCMMLMTKVTAQSTATASATATIVTPIGITKTAGVDMSFENIAVNSAAGTVNLSTAGVRTATGGVTLPNSSGVISAASFDVTGSAGYTYSISMPSTISLVHSNTTSSMSITAISNSVGSIGTLDASTGTQNIKVGATLNSGSNQLAGVYSNTADLSLTVNYN
jgi:hypothetical protein